MTDVAYVLTRSTGIVAAVLVVAALLWGFLFSARATGKRLRPNWWLDLHNWLGGLALGFTAAHIVLSLLDSTITLERVVVPGAPGDQRWAITWGVLATYALCAVVFTTWPVRMTHRRWWRIIHLISVPATVLAILHGYLAGTDASHRAFQVGVLAATAVGTYGLALRLSTLRFGRSPD